jgi:hypothetical protein
VLAYRRGLGQRAKPCVAGEFSIGLAGLRRNAHFTVILGIANHTTTTRIVRDTLGYHQPRFTSMKRETIAIHGGFDSDPTTKAVAVPIYQTAAYSFDSAEHGAALFNLEVPGFRYTRISNPTTEVLEQRVTELEGGVGALSVASGQTALFYASMNALETGRNLITVPQLYGTTYTLFAHILPKMGIQVRLPSLIAPRILKRSSTTTPVRSFARPWVIQPATSAIWRHWQRSRIAITCR